ncbi:cell division protein FtsK [Bacillus toyonensis]
MVDIAVSIDAGIVVGIAVDVAVDIGAVVVGASSVALPFVDKEGPFA